MRGIWSSLDWVITGYRQDGKCFVLASDSLAKGTLETKTDYEVEDPFALIVERRPWAHSFKLTVESQRLEVWDAGSLYTIAWGETYAEALRNLMANWSPSEGEPRPGLPMPQKELE